MFDGMTDSELALTRLLGDGETREKAGLEIIRRLDAVKVSSCYHPESSNCFGCPDFKDCHKTYFDIEGN